MQNVLLQGDCLELMKDIPDGAVDMVLTDLPFGTVDCDWDVKIPLAPFWEQIKRITKENAAIVLFSQLPFGAELIMSNPKMFRYEWVWEKFVSVGFLNAHKMPLRAHENILVFYRKLPTYNPQFTEGKPYTATHLTGNTGVYGYRKGAITESDGRRYPRDVLKFKSLMSYSPKDRYHSTQKPVDLLEYLIKTYTNDGELVLDATMGSGSTCVAAVNTNRKYIGIEKEPKFYEISCRRVARAVEKRESQLLTDAC